MARKKSWRETALGQELAVEDEFDDDEEDVDSDSLLLGRETPELLKRPKKEEEPLSWWDKLAGGKESPGPLASTGKNPQEPSGNDEFSKALEESNKKMATELSSHTPSKSSGSASFAKAFAAARREARAKGKDPDKAIFWWGKKKYNTKLA